MYSTHQKKVMFFSTTCYHICEHVIKIATSNHYENICGGSHNIKCVLTWIYHLQLILYKFKLYWDKCKCHCVVCVQVSYRSLSETVHDNIHLNNLNGLILLHVEEQIYKCLKYWQILMARVQTNFCGKICVIFSFSSFFSCDPY